MQQIEVLRELIRDRKVFCDLQSSSCQPQSIEAKRDLAEREVWQRISIDVGLKLLLRLHSLHQLSTLAAGSRLLLDPGCAVIEDNSQALVVRGHLRRLDQFGEPAIQTRVVVKTSQESRGGELFSAHLVSGKSLPGLLRIGGCVSGGRYE